MAVTESMRSMLGVSDTRDPVAEGMLRRENWRGTAAGLRAFLVGRSGATILLQGTALVSVLFAHATAQSQQVGLTEAFFAGAYGPIGSYLLALLLPVGYAIAYLVRTEDTAGELGIYAALRHGSYRRWTGSIVTREIPHIAAFAVGVGVVLILGAAILDQPISMLTTETSTFYLGLLGLFASTLVFCSLATLLAWTGRRVYLLMFPTVILAAVVGYLIPASLGWMNIVAPFSALHDAELVGAPIFAPAAALVAAGILILAAIWRATPKNADGLV
ncbi:hypothetical protein D9V32_09890 [Mycetocola tolaasinivorans]|uniref:Uncharacterized protein n=1 Tax=Mycetocola tolaasinivorans TaxID=76635 RepID=A0A3L7A4E6_9MICO|nr:hypothetical protein D9V32_09890 [Mycetocola tolaasinivorans]